MGDELRAEDRIIVALDTPTAQEAIELVEMLTPKIGHFKVGLELFCAEGSEIIKQISSRGGRVFLDLKFHDIPNTVAGAARVLSGTGAWMTNVHAAGGKEMMRAAREALPNVELLAVTVLTSLNERQVHDFWGVPESLLQVVKRWALGARDAGLNGVVCSPREVGTIRECIADDFTVVTPGIRPKWAASYDQKRVTTPRDAILKGSDYLVIGRPIRRATDPREAAKKIADEIRDALTEKEG